MNTIKRQISTDMTLPTPPAPAGQYEPAVVRNGIGFVSGQVPVKEGKLIYTGRVGDELTISQGKRAAALAALNMLAQIERTMGSWDRFGGLLRVDGYVASAEGFFDQPAVLDGASELFLQHLADLGRHARSAVIVPRLPWDAPVELVVTFTLRDAESDNQETKQ